MFLCLPYDWRVWAECAVAHRLRYKSLKGDSAQNNIERKLPWFENQDPGKANIGLLEQRSANGGGRKTRSMPMADEAREEGGEKTSMYVPFKSADPYWRSSVSEYLYFCSLAKPLLVLARDTVRPREAIGGIFH